MGKVIMVEMRDGLRGDRLIRRSVCRSGNVESTKRYMKDNFTRSYVNVLCLSKEEVRDPQLRSAEFLRVKKALKWRVVSKEKLSQKPKPKPEAKLGLVLNIDAKAIILRMDGVEITVCDNYEPTLKAVKRIVVNGREYVLKEKSK